MISLLAYKDHAILIYLQMFHFCCN